MKNATNINSNARRATKKTPSFAAPQPGGMPPRLIRASGAAFGRKVARRSSFCRNGKTVARQWQKRYEDSEDEECPNKTGCNKSYERTPLERKHATEETLRNDGDNTDSDSDAEQSENINTIVEKNTLPQQTKNMRGYDNQNMFIKPKEIISNIVENLDCKVDPLKEVDKIVVRKKENNSSWSNESLSSKESVMVNLTPQTKRHRKCEAIEQVALITPSNSKTHTIINKIIPSKSKASITVIPRLLVTPPTIQNDSLQNTCSDTTAPCKLTSLTGANENLPKMGVINGEEINGDIPGSNKSISKSNSHLSLSSNNSNSFHQPEEDALLQHLEETGSMREIVGSQSLLSQELANLTPPPPTPPSILAIENVKNNPLKPSLLSLQRLSPFSTKVARISSSSASNHIIPADLGTKRLDMSEETDGSLISPPSLLSHPGSEVLGDIHGENGKVKSSERNNDLNVSDEQKWKSNYLRNQTIYGTTAKGFADSSCDKRTEEHEESGKEHMACNHFSQDTIDVEEAYRVIEAGGMAILDDVVTMEEDRPGANTETKLICEQSVHHDQTYKMILQRRDLEEKKQGRTRDKNLLARVAEKEKIEGEATTDTNHSVEDVTFNQRKVELKNEILTQREDSSHGTTDENTDDDGGQIQRDLETYVVSSSKVNLQKIRTVENCSNASSSVALQFAGIGPQNGPQTDSNLNEKPHNALPALSQFSKLEAGGNSQSDVPVMSQFSQFEADKNSQVNLLIIPRNSQLDAENSSQSNLLRRSEVDSEIEGITLSQFSNASSLLRPDHQGSKQASLIFSEFDSQQDPSPSSGVVNECPSTTVSQGVSSPVTAYTPPSTVPTDLSSNGKRRDVVTSAVRSANDQPLPASTIVASSVESEAAEGITALAELPPVSIHPLEILSSLSRAPLPRSSINPAQPSPHASPSLPRQFSVNADISSHSSRSSLPAHPPQSPPASRSASLCDLIISAANVLEKQGSPNNCKTLKGGKLVPNRPGPKDDIGNGKIPEISNDLIPGHALNERDGTTGKKVSKERDANADLTHQSSLAGHSVTEKQSAIKSNTSKGSVTNSPKKRTFASTSNTTTPSKKSKKQCPPSAKSLILSSVGKSKASSSVISSKSKNVSKSKYPNDDVVDQAANAALLASQALSQPTIAKQLLLSMALVRTNPRTPPSSYPSRGTILSDRFHWAHFQPLETVLRKHMKEYYDLSTNRCQSRDQQSFNNELVDLVRAEAAKHGWQFDEAVFDDRKIRDRIRCFFKTHIQNAKKRLNTMLRNPEKRANVKALAAHFHLIEDKATHSKERRTPTTNNINVNNKDADQNGTNYDGGDENQREKVCGHKLEAVEGEQNTSYGGIPNDP